MIAIVILSIFAGAAFAAALAISLVYCGVSLTASAAMSAAALGTRLQMKLTTETQTAGFLATATRRTSIAVSALSTFFAFATNMLAMYGISAPGAFSKAALITFLSTAAEVDAIDPKKVTDIAKPTINRVFFFIFVRSFTVTGPGSLGIDSKSVNPKNRTFFIFISNEKTADLPL